MNVLMRVLLTTILAMNGQISPAQTNADISVQVGYAERTLIANKGTLKQVASTNLFTLELSHPVNSNEMIVVLKTK